VSEEIMPHAGEKIENPRTGQRMVFLQTGADTDGELLRIECFSPATAMDEPEHCHPRQESRAHVISGTLRFRVRGEVQEVSAGESHTIPAGVPHSFGNYGDEEAHWIGEFRPALRTDAFFETLFDLAAHDELDERGMPSLLQLAVSVPAFSEEIRVTRPPWLVQRALFALLGPIARRRGLHADRSRHRGLEPRPVAHP
jgi:quercetin dioxygenase-like cupin family protein